MTGKGTVAVVLNRPDGHRETITRQCKREARLISARLTIDVSTELNPAHTTPAVDADVANITVLRTVVSLRGNRHCLPITGQRNLVARKVTCGFAIDVPAELDPTQTTPAEETNVAGLSADAIIFCRSDGHRLAVAG